MNITGKNIFINTDKDISTKGKNNFDEQIKPLLSLAASKDIDKYILSEDWDSEYDLYMVKDENSKITHIHTHIADNKDDKIL